MYGPYTLAGCGQANRSDGWLEDTLIVHVDLAPHIDIKDIAVLSLSSIYTITINRFKQLQLTDLNMYRIIMGTEGLA